MRQLPTATTVCLALLLTLARAHGAEMCFSCHAAPGLERRIDEGRQTSSETEGAVLKGKAHAGLRCVDCHPAAATVPHPEHPGARPCESCHQHYQGHVVSAADRGQAAGARIPVCVDCHGYHGIAPPSDPDSKVYHAKVPELCGQCHGPNGARPYAPSYLNSVHGRAHQANPNGPAAVCTDCHGAHARQEGDTLITTVSRPRLPGTCGKCHAKEAAAYRDSIHGRAMAANRQEAAVCTDCHGEHNILPVQAAGAPTSAARVSETCARCHGDARIIRLRGLPADRVTSYRASYHGAANKWGDVKVANCTSCHGYHDILPSSDPRSSINPANLARTCGACHPGSRLKYTSGDVHRPATSFSARVGQWIQIIYLLLIGGTLSALMGYIVLDLLAFVRWRRRGGPAHLEAELAAMPPPPASGLIRLTRNERLQHWVLLVSFTLLALTGLPLLAPQNPLSRAVVSLCLGPTGRSILHRVAAVGLLAGAAYHVGYLLFTRRGRRWLRDLVPGFQDVKDVWTSVMYFFGRSQRRPEFGRFGFPEKFEYFGVVWGTFIMGLTGFLLAFENLSLRYLPKWAWDASQAIHGWEAILAVAVIALWHMYHTVWKPGIYPMSRAWLTGDITFRQLIEEHPRFYRDLMEGRRELDTDETPPKGKD